MRFRQHDLEPARVWLTLSALEAMELEASLRAPDESGGMLLGYRQRDSQVAITAVTGPGPRAVHRRSSFVPDGKWQQAELARIYEESGRVTTYLGDWHSHPRGAAVPSVRDLKTARRVARRRRARTRRPITLILAGDESTWRPAVFELLGGRLVPVEVRTYR